MKNHAKPPVSRVKATLALLFCLLFPLFAAWSQNNYAVQANIIYRFTKYINWPEDKNTGEFIIGIVGDTPLYDELTNYTSNRTVGGRPIVIKKLPATASSYCCHILFISDVESASIKRIVSNTTGAATLLVSESKGVTPIGSCINFTLREERLELEINKTAIEKRKLDIATELLSLGRIVI